MKYYSLFFFFLKKAHQYFILFFCIYSSLTQGPRLWLLPFLSYFLSLLTISFPRSFQIQPSISPRVLFIYLFFCSRVFPYHFRSLNYTHYVCLLYCKQCSLYIFKSRHSARSLLFSVSFYFARNRSRTRSVKTQHFVPPVIGSADQTN